MITAVLAAGGVTKQENGKERSGTSKTEWNEPENETGMSPDWTGIDRNPRN